MDDPNDNLDEIETKVIDQLKQEEYDLKQAEEDLKNDTKELTKDIPSRDKLNEKQNKVYDKLITDSTPDYLLNDPRVIGYNTREEQNLLFGILSQIGVIPSQESILDIGCGVGDYYNYVKQNIDTPVKYLGIDINPNMVNLAEEKYPDANFVTEDLADCKDQFDFVVASGLFNLNITDDMYTYVYKSIDKMYELSTGGVAFNMLSNDNNISPIDGLSYYNSIDIFQYCKEKFNRVILRHDYLDDDFTIFIYK